MVILKATAMAIPKDSRLARRTCGRPGGLASIPFVPLPAEATVALFPCPLSIALKPLTEGRHAGQSHVATPDNTTFLSLSQRGEADEASCSKWRLGARQQFWTHGSLEMTTPRLFILVSYRALTSEHYRGQLGRH